jgi:fructose-specific phosphotransferase system IIC component
MVFIHPAIQAIGIAIGLYAGYLGWHRFRGREFQWKRHIGLGYAFFVIIIAGTLIGFAMTYFMEGGILRTGLHALLPFIIVPLLSAGLTLGFTLSKGKRAKSLAVLHMSINYCTLLLIFLQGYWGVRVLVELLGAR